MWADLSVQYQQRSIQSCEKQEVISNGFRWHLCCSQSDTSAGKIQGETSTKLEWNHGCNTKIIKKNKTPHYEKNINFFLKITFTFNGHFDHI